MSGELRLCYRLDEVAEAFSVSVRTVRRWIDAGRLTAVRPGGRGAPLLVLAESVERFLVAEQAKAAGARPGGPTR